MFEPSYKKFKINQRLGPYVGFHPTSKMKLGF